MAGEEERKFPSPMTQGEIAAFRGFPNLHPNQVMVLKAANKGYNCVAWSLGFQDRWINTGTKTQLETMYQHYYFVSCGAAEAEIDAYAKGEAPQHVSKKQTATSFSSKMGDQVVLEHPRTALEDSGPKAKYGMIYGHFQKHASHPGTPPDPTKFPPADHPKNHPLPGPLPVGHPSGNPPTSTHHPTTPATHPTTTQPKTPPKTPPHGVKKEVLPRMEAFDAIPPSADEAVASVNELHNNISVAYPDAAENFEKLYDAWKATWDNEDKHLSSNSTDFAQGPEFDALVKLGPAAIPFVLKKIASPDDFFAVELYNAIEKDAGVKVDADNVLDHNVLQRHANLIVDMNHQRNETFNQKVKEWRDHQKDVELSSNSDDKIDSEAFKTIVAMGQSVVGHAMEAYSKEPDGWWHEALHQIVHGEPSGSGTFVKDKLFGDWKKWFESGKSSAEAPKGS